MSSLAARRSRRGWAIAGAALAAAAAVAVVVRAPWRPHSHAEPRLALADTRPVEVRFSAHDFGGYRPYRVERGAGPAAAPIPLATLSALERRADKSALVAALVWSGDRTRATSVLDTMPATDPSVLADRAAVLVLAGQPEAALEAADAALRAAPQLPAARWNRALALRDLGLPLAAAAELESLAATKERGWSDEAAARAKALRDPVETTRAARLDASARRKAAIAGGGRPLTAADVDVAPTVARHYFHDALRVAATTADVDALAPLAAALDRQSGGDECARELARVRGLDLARRAAFAPRYRAVASGQASAADVDRLLADLEAAGPSVDDVRLGVLLLAGRAADQRTDVERLAAGSDDPWFVLLAVQLRLEDGRPADGDLELAARSCNNPAWALRCAAIDHARASILEGQGRVAEAEGLERQRLELLAVGGTGTESEPALAHLAELERYRGRLALSAATATEALAYVDPADCKARTFAFEGLAEVARRRGDFARARTWLAAPDACPGAVDLLAVGTAVDLASQTGDPADVALATRWIAAGRAAGLPADYLDAAQGRLHIGDEAGAREVLLDVATHPPAIDVGPAIADWAWRTLVDDDGRRGDWNGAFLHTENALAQEGPATCAITLAYDDGIFTAAWRDSNGTAGGAQWREPAPWPPLPASALYGCTTTAVVAMSPLHGRPPPWKLGAWAWST
ncbi:MAG TPA: hypothetical protein VHE35_22960, partial [Kofleriaceae bacterium]|nr:hypothetical protein [Kofleriaceae bacterium]